MKRLLFRDKKGRFVKQGFTGTGFFMDDKAVKISFTGLSKRKKALFISGDYSAGKTFKPMLSEIMKTADSATNIEMLNNEGEFVTPPYKGNVYIKYYDEKGNVISEHKLRGLTHDKFKLIRPRGIKYGKYTEYKFTKKDGNYLWKAFKNKGISVSHLNKVEVTIKFLGEKYTIHLDLQDAKTHQTRVNKKYPVSRYWTKTYFLCWSIKEYLFKQQFRFSNKDKVTKGKKHPKTGKYIPSAVQDYQIINTLRIGIRDMK